MRFGLPDVLHLALVLAGTSIGLATNLRHGPRAALAGAGIGFALGHLAGFAVLAVEWVLLEVVTRKDQARVDRCRAAWQGRLAAEREAKARAGE